MSDIEVRRMLAYEGIGHQIGFSGVTYRLAGRRAKRQLVRAVRRSERQAWRTAMATEDLTKEVKRSQAMDDYTMCSEVLRCSPNVY